jgi:TolB-like protein/DNA-binding winged helix-turn-helix (wHTH) protein/Tfp pilus assembly protein PilF
MATQPRVADRLRFDGFELDVRAGELRKNGVRVRLRGQPLQVLEVLLERAGEVVTREELQGRIWSGGTFVDFDHSLHNAIARIREVLGDSAESPRYIETLPRRGYRYIGPVEDFQRLRLVEAMPARTREPVAPVPPRERKGTTVLVLLSLLTLGILSGTIWRSMRAKDAMDPIRSLAVLPLDNLSGDPSEEFFADGMTDQLITDLAKVGSLRVISRTSVMQYKGAKKRLPAIAEELNVDAIVEGSVVRSGQRVRVTAQLIQASTDRHLWADTYDRDVGDVLLLQGEVADAIAEQVQAKLTPQQQAQLRQGHVVNPAAYDAYLKGHLYYTTEFTKPDSLKKAQGYFEDAIQKDQNFALAYAGLAGSYVFRAYAGALPTDQAYRSSKAALSKALELDDSIGEAYDILGELSWNFDWDWEAADREFNRAIALAPSYSCAHEDRAGFLAFMGRRVEALAELKKIDQLDYGFSAAHTETGVYYTLEDFPRLIEASKRGLLLDPNDAAHHYSLGIGYEGTGRLQEAISEYQKAIELSGGSRGTVALAHAYSAQGKKAEANKILRDLEGKLKQTSASPYTMATIYAGLGETDKAFDFLEKSYAQKSFEILSLKCDSLLDGLRSDPRFQNLVRHLGVVDESPGR